MIPVDTLSHGERQWLEIAMLVASRPKLLLLDEPTTGMTEEGKRRTAELIQRIAENHTVLLVEHDMHLVRRIARKVTVMHQGQVLAEGPLKEVVDNETGERGLSRQERAQLMLRISGIDTFYGTSHIIHGLSLEIGDGELVSVLGRNGAGKTTLLRSITGVNPPTIRLHRAQWRRHHPAQIPSAHPSRHQLRAAGPADHSRHHRPGKHPSWRFWARA